MIDFVELNGNPWHKNLPDCTIRALSLITNRGYTNICDLFGVPWKAGQGITITEGVATVEHIIEVCEDNDFIVNSDVDHIFDDALTNDEVIIDDEDDFYDTTDSLIDVEAGLSLQEFCEIYPQGRYICFLRPTSKARKTGERDWHSTCLTIGRKGTIYDTFDCRRGWLVFGWMQIKESAVVSKDDPQSRASERQKIGRGELIEPRPKTRSKKPAARRR